MLAKAKLIEVKWTGDPPQAQKVSGGKEVEAQFNPETLKITFENENRGGGQPGGASTQYVGSGTSKMSVELLFDTSVGGTDVRENTKKVAYFIQAKPDRNNRNSRRTPPGLSFEWGSFIFRGIVNSMEETLDYFSEEGVPLRANISLNMSRPEIEFIQGSPGESGGGTGADGTPGQATGATTPLEAARAGDSVQSVASRNGKSRDWKAIAAANNIDDPLRLSAGALIDVNAKVNLKASVGLNASATAGVGASGGARASAGASAGIRRGR